MSRVVMPRAYNARIFSSIPASRTWRFFTNCGANVPARSRGVSICNSPNALCTVLRLLPLRTLPPERPCGAWPTWACISASNERLIMCCNICENSFSTSCGVLQPDVSSSSIVLSSSACLLLSGPGQSLVKGQLHSSIYRLADPPPGAEKSCPGPWRFAVGPEHAWAPRAVGIVAFCNAGQAVVRLHLSGRVTRVTVLPTRVCRLETSGTGAISAVWSSGDATLDICFSVGAHRCSPALHHRTCRLHRVPSSMDRAAVKPARPLNDAITGAGRGRPTAVPAR